jgi:hypothetical protein
VSFGKRVVRQIRFSSDTLSGTEGVFIMMNNDFI